MRSTEAPLEPCVADLEIAIDPIAWVENATQWRELLNRVQDAKDEVFDLASRAGPTSWLTGAVVLVVAVELVRLRRAQTERRPAPARVWPDIVAPSELA
jgi:hypothetical protein